ncbi:MAG: ABC transporter permease [Oscillospiraceae bacterium]|jgi:peptide/nickel transport system permease protein|nr:ABC transporter permease [Oscillospiraceae bacterium]
MLRYVCKRLVMLVPIILGITFIVFFILSLTPGDPARMILGANATPEQVAAMRAQMGLDDPVILRYIKYIGGALRGDFGTSWSTRDRVFTMVFGRFPYTFRLAFLSMLLTVALSIPLGIYSAVRKGGFGDNATMVLSMVMAATPKFWLGILMMLVFSVWLRWLPTSGLSSWKNYIMPTIAMSAASTAINTRIVRASVLDVIRQDFIRTARAKGARESVIFRKHALRNAMLPVVTVLGMSFAGSLGGSVLIENVFSIPGVGLLMIERVRQKDIPAVLACVIFIAVVFAVVNLITDILYSFIDPRIKAQYTRRSAKKPPKEATAAP